MKMSHFSRFGLACIATAFASTAAFAQTSDPVGFTTLNIKGTGGTKASEITYLGLSMVPSGEYRNVAETVSGTVLTCSTATWTDNQYASTPAPGYFLEVFSGAKAGLLTQVVSCSATSKTVTVADNLTTLGVEGTNVTFKIRPNWSLATLFGATNTAGLQPGSSTTADLVLIYNPNLGGGAGGYDTYYYSNVGGLIGNGWRKSGAGNTDQANALIAIDEAILVKRLQSADLNFTVQGAVKLGQTITTVFAGPNFIGNVYPAGQMTLGTTDLAANPPKYSSGLYTDATGATGVKPGSSTTADLILIYNPTLGGGAGGYDTYYYSNVGGLIGNGWRKSGAGNVDQSATVLASGRAILLKRSVSAPGSFNWVMPQPFATP